MADCSEHLIRKLDENKAHFAIRIAFLRRKWTKELEYRLIKELWAFTENRIAVRFAYEWHDDSGNWFRSYGNENWEFAENGPDASATC
jgi:nuclear transport factor 2 (NTF2) superfamily protein